eukprot:TRINITY_DN25490_c0_g1_i1.p1 TRINITY_DN25490_c0_g1~~TRINITY_DN25490_c0_g1_i1.p1  ORF type:complete len:282 (+),score=57.71 TRINITY_DN25490_c0_g1_i1:33-878(+)
MSPLPPAFLEVVEHIRRDGFAILDGLLPLHLVQECASAVMPLLPQSNDDVVKLANRGPMRHYFDLRPQGPFFGVLAQAALVAILRSILGDNFIAYQLAVDTPYLGSVFQDYHPDGLRPIDFGADPSSLGDPVFLSLNFPLVDINDTNGPFEIIAGTQHLPVAEADNLLEVGSLKPERLHMRRGDVMIRDLRTLHRGSPNLEAAPRPMAVWGFAAGREVVWGEMRDGDRVLPGPEALVGTVRFENEAVAAAEWRELNDLQRWLLRLWPLEAPKRGEEARDAV